jgi:hypothetical protein
MTTAMREFRDAFERLDTKLTVLSWVMTLGRPRASAAWLTSARWLRSLLPRHAHRCLLALRTPRRLSARHADFSARHRTEAGVRAIVNELIADCLHRGSAVLAERCDVLFPALLTLFPAR